MKTISAYAVEVCLVALFCVLGAWAQDVEEAERQAAEAPPASPEPSGLRLVKFSGLVRDALGQPRSGVIGITFALYKDQEGGAPLWLETQNVELDAEGGYTLLLGAASSEGLPLEIFTSEEARWLGVQVQGEEEQPRILLVSVPYALKAADAETLGGKPLSAFVQVESESTSTSAAGEEAATSGGSEPAVTSGTAGRIAKFTNATDLGDSVMFESGGSLGVGTTSPTGFQVNAALATEEAQGVDNFRLGIFLGTPRMILEDAGSPVWELDNAGGLFRIFNPGVLSFAIDASGNVGVGTGSPTGFQVNAALGTEEAQGVDNFRMGIFLGTPRMILEDAGSPVWELDNAGGTFRIFNPGFLRFAIDPSGNVGVGTASPTAKLQVVGAVAATAFVGDGSALTGVGDITAVNTAVGSGLQGGSVSGAANLSLLTSCGSGQLLKWNGISWTCADDAVGAGGGGGDITAVIASTGLTGGASSGDATLSLDTAFTDGRYPLLVGTNNFSGTQNITGNVNATGAITGGAAIFSSFSTAVLGSASGTSGVGVAGEATAGSGTTFGVSGFASSTAGTGVAGHATAGSGGTTGVLGISDSSSGVGVFGVAGAASGVTVGVHGQVDSPAGIPGLFVNTAGGGPILSGFDASTEIFTVAASANGILKVTQSNSVPPFPAPGDDVPAAVFGESTALTNFAVGVLGTTASSGGVGVLGWAASTLGEHWGVMGGADGTNGVGVVGMANALSGQGVGVRGLAENGPDGVGVQGRGGAIGVHGKALESTGVGVKGEAPGIGILGRTSGSSGSGIAAFFESGDTVLVAHPGNGADFVVQGDGDVIVNGCLWVGSVPLGGNTCPPEPSDARLKTNIVPLPRTLDKVAQLVPVSFDWQAEKHPDLALGRERSLGLVAQQVEEVLPELVTEGDNGFKAVNYHQLPLLLLQALRELAAEKDGLAKQLEAQAAELASFKAQLEETKLLLRQMATRLDALHPSQNTD